jgi:hypothetical protein
LGGLESEQKLNIIRAVNNNRTTDIGIKQVSDLYGLLQIGVHVDVNDLDSQTADMLLMYANEVGRKQEREMRSRG